MPTAHFDRTLQVSASPAECWKTLTDVPTLVEWVSVLDDAAELEHLERYSAVLADRLGPFRLRADLDIRVGDTEQERRIAVSARGEDRQVSSRISVDAVLRLEPGEHGTVVAVEGTYEVAGRVATMGAGTIRKKADKILDEFFGNAEAALT
jgi:uncharacterized protein